MKHRSFGAAALLLALSLFAPEARADLGGDLTGLVSRLGAIDTALAGASFSDPTSCLDLGTINTSVRDYLAASRAVEARLAAPLRPKAADYLALDELGRLARQAAAESARLSVELRTASGALDGVEVRAGLSAMLQLSTDIGVMANRILEMADRILAMSDNIGVMANRILATQELQSANMAATQAALLTTQVNAVALSDSVSSIAYDTTLGLLGVDAGALAQQMGGTTLTTGNLGASLTAIELQTAALLTRVAAISALVEANSARASHLVSGDTLTALGDLSAIQRTMALSIEGFARAVEALAPFTDDVVLGDATRAVLKLASDVGAMSKRVVEMSDRIIVMADDIGLMADRIVETEAMQRSNLELTGASLLTAQTITLTVLRNLGG